MTIMILGKQISEYFSKGELRNLCFDLEINYENLPGETLDQKARELVAYCYRHGQLKSLVEKCRQLRPFVSWTDIQIITDGSNNDVDNHSGFQEILISIEHGDVTSYNADVLALKFANYLFGADRAVANSLGKDELELLQLLPNVNDYQLIPSLGRINPKQVLFQNVGDLYAFDYGKIREFASNTLKRLSDSATFPVKHLAMTIHGIGYGLDEVEAFNAQLAGFLDAFEDGDCPQNLEKITIVEFHEDRVNRLRIVLNNAISVNPIPVPKVRKSLDFPQQFITRSALTRSVGRESANKPHVIVSMTSSENTDDLYYYGIQEPVNALGYLCEKANLSNNEDAFERTKTRIETASVVIAELTGKNPNVFLLLGYAWGCGRPTILLVNHGEENFPFDINKERILVYRRIRDLEKALRNELELLKN